MEAKPNKATMHKVADLHDRYVPGDPIPVPEVIEADGDTAWALWSESMNANETSFAETVPAPLPSFPAEVDKQD